MPYSSMKDVNPSIRGIKPPVTLAQANEIAAMADALERGGEVESPWAVAISNFKKTHVVKNGRWVKKAEESMSNLFAQTKIDIDGTDVSLESLIEAWRLKEAKTKTENGVSYPASAYLVVEDPDRPSTWHLRVRDKNGKPDHRLMGGAWAALHGGYRGNKYEGPDKTKAIAKLKALYKSEDMQTPGVSEANVGEVYPYDTPPPTYVPANAISFATLDAARDAEAFADSVRQRVDEFQQMVENIMWSPEVEDKPVALINLLDEFIGRISTPSVETITAQEQTVKEQVVEEEVGFAESYGGVVNLLEKDVDFVYDGGPLKVEVAVLEPGWGNKEDNNYYPREVLQRDANKIAGAKMYVTDHRQSEKNVRTEVSEVLECPVRFTETGAPVALVGIYDEDFARTVYNRWKLGRLENLQCSILGTGIGQSGFKQDGRTGYKITELKEIKNVDWVTRAGAGGRALNIVENSNGGRNDMLNKDENEKLEKVEGFEGAKKLEKAEGIEKAEKFLEEVDIHENKEETESKQEENLEEQTKPTTFTAADVLKKLLESGLPNAVQMFLVEASYETPKELDEAIERQKKVVAEIRESLTSQKKTSGAKPFAMGGTAKKKIAEVDNKTIGERIDAVNERYFGR